MKHFLSIEQMRKIRGGEDHDLSNWLCFVVDEVIEDENGETHLVGTEHTIRAQEAISAADIAHETYGGIQVNCTAA